MSTTAITNINQMFNKQILCFYKFNNSLLESLNGNGITLHMVTDITKKNDGVALLHYDNTRQMHVVLLVHYVNGNFETRPER